MAISVTAIKIYVAYGNEITKYVYVYPCGTNIFHLIGQPRVESIDFISFLPKKFCWR
jgi:hypothetical protein